MKKNRIDWVDCAKGITLLLVIIGHTVSTDASNMVRAGIFSFHMTLFFVVSCVTGKLSNSNDEFVKKTEKGFKHLILPALFIYITVLIYVSSKCISEFRSWEFVRKFLKESLLTMVFSSGVNLHVLSAEIKGLDIPWFLVVMFLGKTLFDYMHLKLSGRKLIVGCLLLSVTGVVISRLQWLPLSFDIVLTIMPMFYIGYILRKFCVEHKPVLKLLIFGTGWFVTFYLCYKINEGCNGYPYMVYASRQYPSYPFCFLSAILGTLMIAELSVILCKQKKIISPLLYLGKNSLYMLVIHGIDSTWMKRIWLISENIYINIICRIIVDIVVFAAVMYVRGLWNKSKQQSRESMPET